MSVYVSGLFYDMVQETDVKSWGLYLQMQASMQQRPQERTFGMVMKEVDKDLALFLEMRNRENEKGDLFLNEKLDGVDDLTEINCEEILTNGVEDGRDFDWLLPGPDTRFVPLDVERPTSLEEKNENLNSSPLTSRSSRTTLSEGSASLKSKSMQPAKPANIRSSGDGNRRPISSGGRRSMPSRPATPTGRPSLPVMSKPSRSSTPNSRATGPSIKTVVPAVRSSTPTRVIARSSTPTSRSSISTSSKSVSRSATPTPIANSSVLSTAKSKSRSATPTSTARSSVPSTTKTSSRPETPTYKPNITSAPSGQSSKVAKAEHAILKSSVTSRGASPTVKSRPSKTSEMSSFQRDSLNLSTTVTKRPNSASRVRPSAANPRSSLIEANSIGNPRQQSCSPSRMRSSNVNARNTGPAMLSKSYGYGSGGDDVNPVLIGTQMVERVVNMRKLAPPKPADYFSDIIPSKKSSTSQENSGFGRSLSKKSLDMAIRHMDLTRTIAGDIRPSKVSTSASSINVRNGTTKSKTETVSKSPPSTSRIVSSELNLNADSESLNARHIDSVDTYNDMVPSPPNFKQVP
ncbi:hypothetical protein Leryth_011644 [Lithospermum erythrorhizon]|nr:hypothetical protein Leryth_011644 [Lithospermum erythrorhizon]